MTNKEAFIEFIKPLFKQEDVDPKAKEYWDSFIAQEETKVTENGKEVLRWMRANCLDGGQTSKVIGENMGTPSRTVSGTMRKLVADGFVTKSDSSPIVYSLTQLGKEICID